jgi:hypothetical protein
MSAARFDIEQITVTLDGALPTAVSARSFQMALIERLGAWQPDLDGVSSLQLGNVDLGNAVSVGRLDAPGLATIVADRLIDRIGRAIARSQESA